MDPERWRIIEATFHEALTHAPAERPGFLERACKGDRELFNEVASLLDRSHRTDPLFDKPAWEALPGLLDATEPLPEAATFEVDLAGRTLSHYRILEKIGEGGMGVVWKAMDNNLHREVAMKVLPGSRAFDIGRFLREGQTASALNHPNIVTIYEANTAEGIHFIAMELVHGSTLAERIQAGRVPCAEALQLAVQIADALTHAHAAGVIHRDLKPSNVMITRTGLAKVLDFGIAKQQPLATASPGDTVTAPGMIRGTMAYMSPEQLLGEHVDARSDIFSFGVLMYEVLTACNPFRGATSPLRAVLEGSPSSPRSIAPDLSHGLERIVLRCLEKDPKSRFQSAAELARQLRLLLPPPRRPVPKLPLYAGATTLVMIAAAGIAPIRNAVLAHTPLHAHAINAAAQAGALNESDYYRLARACLDRYDKRGNIEKAIDNLTQAIRINPKYATGYAALSEAYLRRYDLDGNAKWLDAAREQAAKAAAADPNGDLAVVHVAVGASRLADGRLEEAEKEFALARAQDPKNARALLGLAQIAAQNDPEAAAILFQQASALAPNDICIASDFASFRYRQGRYRDAIAILQRSLAASPGNLRALRSIGAAYDWLGQYDEAASTYQRALEIEPSATVYTNIGTSRFYQGKYEEAVRAFEKAVVLSPNSYSYWGNLGDARRWARGQRPKAIVAYDRAITLAQHERLRSPHDPDLVSQLAKDLALSNQGADALALLAQFEQLPVKTSQAIYTAAIAYEACGRRDPAMRSLSEALRAGFSTAVVENDPELAQLRSDPLYHRLALATRNPSLP